MVKSVIKKTELSPDILTKHIRARKAELEQVLFEKERSLKDAPEGKLRFLRKGKSVQYYHKHDHSVPEGVYLKRKQDSFAAALAQKDYDSKLIYELRAELKALDRMIDEYRPERIDEIYMSLHEFLKPLVFPAMLLEEDYVKRWMSVEYEKKAFEENDSDYYTANGERVRSKSEILIADALSRRNIPYRYEYPIHIPGIGTVHPDFICLNVRKRKEYIWEHNGMMSDSDYADYAIKKIKMYTQDVYYPGENLILSFETTSHPLSSRIIEDNINKSLL